MPISVVHKQLSINLTGIVFSGTEQCKVSLALGGDLYLKTHLGKKNYFNY